MKFFFSEEHKDELMKEYEKDNVFFWGKDTSDHNKMHKNGQLINMLNLTPGVKKEDIIDHFYYE